MERQGGEKKWVCAQLEGFNFSIFNFSWKKSSYFEKTVK